LVVVVSGGGAAGLWGGGGRCFKYAEFCIDVSIQSSVLSPQHSALIPKIEHC
jgi:hypothetical protein